MQAGHVCIARVNTAGHGLWHVSFRTSHKGYMDKWFGVLCPFISAILTMVLLKDISHINAKPVDPVFSCNFPGPILISKSYKTAANTCVKTFQTDCTMGESGISLASPLHAFTVCAPIRAACHGGCMWPATPCYRHMGTHGRCALACRCTGTCSMCTFLHLCTHVFLL